MKTKTKIIIILIIFTFIIKIVNIFGITYFEPPKHNKKIAICISGRLTHFRQAYSNLNKYIFRPLKGDIFLCIDSDEKKEDIDYASQIYKPKKTLLLSKKFSNKEEAMFYKIYKCNELKNQYCVEHNINYDLVVRIRPDMYIFGYIDTRIMCQNSLNIPVLSIYNNTTLSPNSYGITDIFAIGNNQIMNTYSKMYKKLKHNNVCNVPEYKLYQHIKKNNIKIKLFHIFFIPYWWTLDDSSINGRISKFISKFMSKFKEDYFKNCSKNLGY